MAHEVLFEVAGPIATIILNRPAQRNAMSWETYDQLEAAFDTIEADESIRVVVIKGAGDKAFAAGADINHFKEFQGSEPVLAYEARVDRVIGRLERLPRPVIAQIRGFATGGGAALAVACDLRIAAEDAQMGVPVARTLGNFPTITNLARMVELVGPAKVKQMLFTAQLVNAQEALAAGLVNEVVPVDQLDERVAALANQIAANAPLTVRSVKEAVRRILAGSRSFEGQDLMLQCYLSEDFKEGVSAFFEKRKPVWRGR